MDVRDPASESEWNDERPVVEEEGSRDEGERDFRGLEEPKDTDFPGLSDGEKEWVAEPRLDAEQYVFFDLIFRGG